MKIAVFVSKSGNIFPLYEKGTVELYSDETNEWQCIKHIPFAIYNDMNFVQVREAIQNMVSQIDDCKMFVVDTIRGFPLTIISENRIGVWKHRGVFSLPLLDHIKSELERIEREQSMNTTSPIVVGDANDGAFIFDLATVLKNDSSLNSRDLLFPFLKDTPFKKLEIICQHLPKWLGNALEELNIQAVQAESNDGLCHAIITPSTHPIAENNLASSVHPCFDESAKHMHARVHLPIAPKCNIQCNYCNRKYDCVNESRPGVTSAVLSPQQALQYMKVLDKKLKQLSVVGIAGPGDPFANPKETLETMRLIKQEFPEKIFCLSTNGLELYPYIDELAKVGVSHVTITINAIDPEIGAKAYSWIHYDKKVYRGIEGAKVLLENQLKCIPKLKEKGIMVKINSIIIPGVNENHIPEVAKKCAELGADVMNCIPLIPTEETDFAMLPKPDNKMISQVRMESVKHIKMMNHCARCRAGAAGLLGQDIAETYTLLHEISTGKDVSNCIRPYVAVATIQGTLVNQHMGEAKELCIYKQTPNGFQYVERRNTPASGLGDKRWLELARMLADCQAILVSGIGDNPRTMLNSCGIKVVEMMGLIDDGLDGIFNNKPIKSITNADDFKCGSRCKGNTMGCGCA